MTQPGLVRGALHLVLVLFALALPGDIAAQPLPETGAHMQPSAAPTLEDILARQRGETVSNAERATGNSPSESADAIRGQLGTLGAASDADVFRQIRFGTGDISVSTGKPVDAVLIQDGGMKWLEWRKGPLAHWGLYALGGMLGVLALFYLLRGRIRIEGGRSGVMIERFGGVERFAHWLLAVSFVLLALTGLFQLLGRLYLIPWLGKETFATAAAVGKWIHNNVAWAFMAGLVLVLVLWIGQNLPRRADLVWIAKGGGMFSKHSHPPAYKFNAGQKILFWLVILLGASVSLSGLSLLFPFELPLFAKTFGFINDAAALVGVEAGLPTELQPQQEMQFAQLWHAIVAFAMMAMILGHIYIGTLGMEGAFSAMGSGEVDRTWAREHHALWVEKLEREFPDQVGKAPPTPAE